MSTWNVITIAEAPRLTETVDQLADEWKVYGHSKYEAEGLARRSCARRSTAPVSTSTSMPFASSLE